jgi:DNA topoisomerase-1
MKLLIVESVGKASLLLEFLRKLSMQGEWEVISCNGHYAGLSPKSLSLDVSKEFSPSWKSRDRKYFKVVKTAVDKADEVYAATDLSPDGEAIAYQVSISSGRAKKPFHRLRLPVLDLESFKKALDSPGDIDRAVFDSFLAREALDRFVKFRLGRALADRLGTGDLSRISSLLLTELARSERKVRKHKSGGNWRVRALLENGSLAASGSIESEAVANEVVRRCKAAEPAYTTSIVHEHPLPPFTTSTLLGFLSDRYGFLPSKSMKMCETLYGLGYITQPYTDSFLVSDSFLDSVRSYIERTFGSELLCSKRRRYVVDGADFRLEAIRPIDISVAPSKSNITGDLKTVYSALWFNSIASQGRLATLEQQVCKYTFVGSTDVVFSAEGTRLSHPGWHQLSSRLFLRPGQELAEGGLSVLEASALFVKDTPPLRHTAASLIAWLDEKAVGRPHNYASSISYLLDAGYVVRLQGRLQITDRGEAVLTYLRRAAPDLIDSDFQAEAEEEIDSVREGSLSYLKFANDYWKWTLETENKMRKTYLRPRFSSPAGGKLRLLVDKDRVWAFSRKEDWWTQVEFDSRGRAAALVSHDTP